MKPIGPIPPAFAGQQGELAIGGVSVSELAEKAGQTPFYVYDLALASAQVARFRTAMPDGLHLHYAVKANPYPAVIQHFMELTDGLDMASGGELAVVRDCGADMAHVSFAGPGKRDGELELAISLGATVNLESETEAERALAIAGKLAITPKLAVRVNPDFELKGSGMSMGGGAKPFGVDQERVPALVWRLLDAGADWRGFHIYSGSQSLDAEAIAQSQEASIALAADLAETIGEAPKTVNLGGGFGIPYTANDTPLDVEQVGERLGAALAGREDILADTQFMIELGRWLIGEAGVYVARILDRKVSKGELFIVTDGGMHHHLAASGNFGMVMKRNYPVAIALKMGAEPAESATIVGPLCTPLDRLAVDIAVPRADIGDLVAVFASGAYGLSASPIHFLSHPNAAEIVVNERKITI
ncbi:pyridoxal-dependent decarboxylase, exosortase A system-associated [Parasphingopyxis marina]|uniref:Pyridoxal-dependent decarboxylase, exosortase A system-associated n=1 Tax=Parasphingopyxis marina TaxID=2761622 RepID=A0A842HZX3_9SPHN|nr:pyridoxal-dependent decarboxylase, exosortase A system-associated [Parasphingopyxis marina]MBC2777929.1 pyridoxal-dependent decarboxylase, exosortase A system-associated [Parasphingopyxis marina]